MPDLVVMKFGGTSVGSSERIGEVAKRVAKHKKATGEDVVVVVSAMAGETNRLIELGRKVGGEKYALREYHQLVSSGEQVSSALTAIALEREGFKAKSLLGSQVPVMTEMRAQHAIISDIPCGNIRSLLDKGITPVVAGFQGIDADGSYVTLGRGGSDTTGVALAAALGAKECHILTDVDGVYSAAPNICKQARLLKVVSYEEMLELASAGAKVLQTRSVHLARKFKVPVIVASSFSEGRGTLVIEEYEGMEDNVVSGITCLPDQAKITLRNLPDKAGIAADIFSHIGESGAVVDMIVQNQGSAGNASISFTLPEAESDSTYADLVSYVNEKFPGVNIEIDKNIAKLSVVGEGMRVHSGIAARMFDVLGREGINIDLITTSEIKISVAIKQKYSELAVRTLHEHFVEAA
ncbi:MAG: aspartate kinase [Bdellovibrionales bacterium]|nr:aspartate kinase [Bdellovibrionales bacterium]